MGSHLIASSTRLVALLSGRALAIMCIAAALGAVSDRLLLAQQPDDAIAPHDVLIVTVWNQAELSGKFTVGSDGTVTYPLVGTLRAGGLQLREFRQQLEARLADGLIKSPQVVVTFERHRSPVAHVFGEVRQPGSLPLTPGMTLAEVLARAGSMTDQAGAVAVVTRARPDDDPPADAPGPPPPEVIRIDLNALQNGAADLQMPIRDGDTVFVPRADRIYVMGQVRSPGSFVIRGKVTVLQAIALAGGLTERGSAKRTRVVREIDGRKQELKVKADHVLLPGDTLVVGERLF